MAEYSDRHLPVGKLSLGDTSISSEHKVTMFAFSTEELRTVLMQLDMAIDKHEYWIRELHGTLICKLPGNLLDMKPEAYRLCSFGQWYYSYPSVKLQHMPAFLAIEVEHAHMHQLATQMLTIVADGKTISLQDYNAFARSTDRLRLQLQSAKRELSEQLYNSDPLTGANTRIGLLKELREQHELVKRKVLPHGLVVMSLDNLKDINDSHGYMAGDQVLIETAAYLKDNLRAYDKVFRYSGQVFVICLPGMDAAQSYCIVERLREDLAQKEITFENGASARVTASFGVAELDSGMPVEIALNRADEALDMAMSAGRNCTRVWGAQQIGSSPAAVAGSSTGNQDSQSMVVANPPAASSGCSCSH